MKKRVVVPTTQIVEEAVNLLGEFLIKKARTEEEKARRAAQMSILYHDNQWSLERVGVAYALSRERIRQIFETYGMETRAPLGSPQYNRPPDLSNLRRVKTNRGNAIVENGEEHPDNITWDDLDRLHEANNQRDAPGMPV